MMANRAILLVLFSLALCASTRSDPQTDSADQLIANQLLSLASFAGGQPIDCGIVYKPDSRASSCAETAFRDGRPFHVLYPGDARAFFHFAYGLAGDRNGNIYEVQYDSRGLLYLGMPKNSKVSDNNRIRVTRCVGSVRLGRTEDGMVACIIPVDEQASKLAARQKPIDTTVCTILTDPAAFNNKLVRVRGYVSANFEYSELGADGCSQSIWFEYGNGGAPPALVAFVTGGARPGAEDSDGRLILPIPVRLLQDSNFRRFQKLMLAAAKVGARSEKKNPNSPIFYCVAATFIGRIDGVSDDIHAFHLKRKATDKADFLGFGQMGLYDAQFVMQSVGNDAFLDKLPPEPALN